MKALALSSKPPRPARPQPPLPIEASNYAPLRRYWAQENSEEFSALSRERDPELLRSGLRRLALRLEADERHETAAMIFSSLGESMAGYRAEFLLQRFTREVCDPTALIGMGLAGAAFQTVRLATLGRLLDSSVAGFWTRGWGARGAAGVFGLFAEAPVFTLSQKALRQVSGRPETWAAAELAKEIGSAALLLGALKLSGAASQGTLRRFGSRTDSIAGLARALLPPAGMLAGIELSRVLEEKLGLRASQDTATRGFEDLLTLLHFHVAGNLGGRLWGRPLTGLDARASWIEAAPRRRLPIANAAAQTEFKSNSGEFSSPEKLSSAFAKAPNFGSREQAFTREAVDRLLKYNAANTTTGSFQNALWQNFLESALSDPDEAHGERALLAAFATFETGPDRSSLEQLAASFGYRQPTLPFNQPIYSWDFWQRHGRVAEFAWSDYFFPSDKVTLLNTVFLEFGDRPEDAEAAIWRFGEARSSGIYPPDAIDGALTYASQSPHSRLVMRRLSKILVGEDSPAKIRELSREDRTDTGNLIRLLRYEDLPQEAMAQRLRGSVHTAYLGDLRLARKVVAVYEEIAPYLKNPRLRAANLEKLRADFLELPTSPAALGTPELISFLHRQTDPQAKALLEALGEAILDIQLVSPNTFDDYVRENNLPASCSLSLFLKPKDPRQASLILLRGMPDRSTFAEPENIFPEAHFQEFMGRVVASFHEWEHFRHFSGKFDAREANSQPFDIQHMTREDRLVSESMAILEQLRWGIQNLDDDFHQVARRMGENLVQFARNMADYGYFGGP